MRDVPIYDVLPFLRKCCCKLPSFIPNSAAREDDEGKDSDGELADDESIFDRNDGTNSQRTGSAESDAAKLLTPVENNAKGWFKGHEKPMS